jgi:DNA-binding transcriptional LysR family regulator
VDSVFPTWLLGPDIAAFREAEAPTRLRLIGEALSGTWEALLDRRADLLVGAPGRAPVAAVTWSSRWARWSSCSRSPRSSVGRGAGVLGREQLVEHCASPFPIPRAVAAAHGGLLMGPEMLTVPDMASKLKLQCEGVGFGFLPEPCARCRGARPAGDPRGGGTQAGRDLLAGLAHG